MADVATIWNPRDREHVAHFAAFLKPFVWSAGTAGTRMFDDATVAAETIQAWILGLADVPADVLEEARARLLAEGITWMPQPGHLKRHAVAIVHERRREIGLQAKALTEACENCHGSTWRRVEIDGIERVTRCGCHEQAIALMAGAPKALPMPRERDDDEAVA